MVWDRDGLQKSVRAGWEYRSRPIIGQVLGVDTVNGTVTVAFHGTHEKEVIDIPMTMSLNGQNSAWQRYMPQERDYVEVHYDVRDRPSIARMTHYHDSRPATAYRQVVAAKNAQLEGLQYIFRSLKRGEFDLRSSGGAGYYFDSRGTALLEAGPTTLSLDKERSETFEEAGLHVMRGAGTELRLGDVKRQLLATDARETAAVPNPTSAPSPKEYRLRVGARAAGAADLVFVEEQAGDVRTDLNVPVLLTTTTQPLRYRKRFFGASGLVETLRVEVDVQGSCKVTQQAAATAGLNLDLAVTPLAVTASRVAVDATVGNVDITAQSQVTLAGGGISASDGAVLGAALSTYLTTKLVVLTALGPSSPAQVPLVAGLEYSANVKVGT